MSLFKRRPKVQPGDDLSVTRKSSHAVGAVTLQYVAADVRIESDVLLKEVQVTIKGKRRDQKLIDVISCQHGHCVILPSREGARQMLRALQWHATARKWLFRKKATVERPLIIIRVPDFTSAMLHEVDGNIDTTRARLGSVDLSIMFDGSVTLGEVNGLEVFQHSGSVLNVQDARGRVSIESKAQCTTTIVEGTISSLDLDIGQSSEAEIAGVVDGAVVETARLSKAVLATVNTHLSIGAGKNSTVHIADGRLRDPLVIEAAPRSTVTYDGGACTVQVYAERKAAVTVSEVSGSLDAEIHESGKLSVPRGNLRDVSITLGHNASFTATGLVLGKITHDPSSVLDFPKVNSGLELCEVRDRP